MKSTSFFNRLIKKTLASLIFGVLVFSFAKPVLAADQLCVCKNDAGTICRYFKTGESGSPASFANDAACDSHCQAEIGEANASHYFVDNVDAIEATSQKDTCDGINALATQNANATNQNTSTGGTTVVNSVASVKDPQIPVLNIPLPGLKFTTPSKQGDNVVVNFLSEYINAIYKLLLGISIAVAIVMLMIGGLQYTFGAVSTAQVEKAKERIQNAVVGLVLLFGTFILLYTVNPQLTLLPPLNLFSVEPNPIDFAHIIKANAVLTAGKSRALNDPAFDDIFKAFGNCVKLDWRVLKGVAFKESGLDHTIGNKQGFVGLFQTNSKFCSDYLKKNPAWATLCTDLTNPALSTAVGARSLDAALKKVEQKCPANISNTLKGMMIYHAHNAGLGGLDQTLNSTTCSSESDFINGVGEYWKKEGHPEWSTTRQTSSKQAAAFINSLGAGDFRDTSANGTAACPLNSAPSNFAYTIPASAPPVGNIKCPTQPSSILAVGDSMTFDPSSYANQIEDACPSVITIEKQAANGRKTDDMNISVTANTLNGKKYLTILGGVNDINNAQNKMVALGNVKSNLTAIYQKAAHANVQVVAITVAPYKGGGSNWSEQSDTAIKDLNTWIKSQEGGLVYKVVDFYSIVKDPNDSQALNPTYDSGDHLHPNAAGHAALAAALSNLIY